MLFENIIPRLIRFKDAYLYVGMDRHRFNIEVRPLITEIPIGTQGIAFDRLDLDNWVDNYKQACGRPPRNRSNKLWDVNAHQDSTSVGNFGTLTKQFSEQDFARALEQATLKRQRSI